MKLFSLILLATGMIASNAPAQEQRLMGPEIMCITVDGLFRFDLYTKLGVIRVYDVKEERFSHDVRGLKIRRDGKIIQMINPAARDGLPAGVIFHADMSQARENGRTVNDRNGASTKAHCVLTR